jgi:mono/diheme cytochrome c family protein
MTANVPAAARLRLWSAVLVMGCCYPALCGSEPAVPPFLERSCAECHDAETRKGGFDLATATAEFSKADVFARWVKVYDRLEAGEMPPKKSKSRPAAQEVADFLKWLRQSLLSAEGVRVAADGRTPLRRLTRSEYENTVRDLFDLPGIPLMNGLPADGSAHGFDKNSDALDISHVNLAKYVEAADQTLDMAIATQPKPPLMQRYHISLAKNCGHILGNGDGVLLKDMKPDPEYPPAGEQGHIDQGAHERVGSFTHGSSVGLFRHEDESFKAYFYDFAALYPGRYRLRLSVWSFGWDKGTVLPARGTEAARLSVVQLSEDGRGTGHPSYVLGYYDAPSLTAQVHEMVTWLNFKDTIGFNTASLAPVANYSRKGRAMAFTGPGIACDWLDVEGPVHEVWPPPSHRLLFGDLPLSEFKAAERPGVRPPLRRSIRQETQAPNQPDHESGLWTVASADPPADAERLLAVFLPKAFRRPVARATTLAYVAKVAERLKAGDCFESAMRWAYRAALCSPDFLYHVEPSGPLDDHALACRLSYFLSDSLPDEPLARLAASGTLREAGVLDREVERLLHDPHASRFIEDFLGQWLKLRQIAANDPDNKLYPEFSPYLQDSMVAETRAYFRALIDQDLDASYLVKSDFAMINEKLAVLYGIPGVQGSQIRRVAVPKGCPRGPFLTQAAILKVTANGTTTSPVPRGAFVMGRLLGKPPEPPPPNIAAVEPDVRGATTIRQLLDKHRTNATCAACHAKIDPPGFALESFDVIGGERARYRSIGSGDQAPRGSIDPFIGIGFKLGLPVDPSGAMPDGRTFTGIAEFQDLLAADAPRLLRNLAEQLAVYAIGRELSFGDRDGIADIVKRTQAHGGGLRTLLHELIRSQLFQTR